MKSTRGAAAKQQPIIITADGIAADIGCSVQTVRRRMQEQATAAGIYHLQVGRSVLYYIEDLPLIRQLLCDESRARGRADRTKKEMRERHQAAYQMRVEEGMSFTKIAAQLNYKTEGGALRAVTIETRRRKNLQAKKDTSVFSLAL